MQLLTARHPQAGQRGVADRVPYHERVRDTHVDHVVVEGGAGRRAGFHADITMRPRAGDAVVHADVVGNGDPGGCSLDVDSGGDALVKAVGDDPRVQRAVRVVDAVVPVVVDHIVEDQVVVGLVELD